ncbi:MAG: hypothetical protein HC892_14755 [Saprospiraceae bacterium]|nr:hypothetical protein [Saprospiraceae bacterium]
MFNGNFSEAESLLLEANKLFLKEEGRYNYWVFINLAIAQNKLGKLEESQRNAKRALELTTKLLKTAPNNPQYLANHALAKFITHEEIESAIKLIESSLLLSLPVEIARSGKEKLEILNTVFKEPLISKTIKMLNEYITNRKAE